VNFTAILLADVAKTVPSSYCSTGGDVLSTDCYASDCPAQQQLKNTGMMLSDALNTFTQATHGALIAEGKTPVVWESEGAFAVSRLNDATE
jgi:hexosaminidase